MDKSPFSVTYQWKFQPAILRSSEEYKPWYNRESLSIQDYDKLALTGLRNIGAIGTTQFVNLYYRNRVAKVKALESKGFLLKHKLLRNGAEMHVYTLGPSAFHLFNLWSKLNYWAAYRSLDIVRRMVFFRICETFAAEQRLPAIYTSKVPLTGTLELNAPLDVLVLKENTADIQSEWRFAAPDRNRHMVVITESLNFLKPIEDILSVGKTRVALEHELFDRSNTLADLFYRWDGSCWTK